MTQTGRELTNSKRDASEPRLFLGLSSAISRSLAYPPICLYRYFLQIEKRQTINKLGQSNITFIITLELKVNKMHKMHKMRKISHLISLNSHCYIKSRE